MRKVIGFAVAIALAFSQLAGVAVADPTPTPSISDLQGKKQVADDQVAVLSAQIATAQNQLAAAQASMAQAEQEYDLQNERSIQAAHDLALAQERRAAAQKQVDEKHAQVVGMVITQYKSGSNMPGASVAALLTAPDPDTLMTQTALRQQIAGEQSAVLVGYGKLLDERAAADAAAKAAKKTQDAATAAATAALSQAQAAKEQAQTQQNTLNALLATAQAQQSAAAVALVTAQQTLAAQQAAAAAASAALSAQYAAASAAARNVPAAPKSATWTAQMGQTAVTRALSWLGTPYSWDGGTANGPTLGVAVDSDSANDGHIVGFDCSGLVMYAWGPYISLQHSAATQYSQAGSLHPDAASLQPGDLVFWNYGGGTIDHVAIYIGSGNIVQAPQSGDVIKVTPLAAMASGLYGFTRPMT